MTPSIIHYHILSPLACLFCHSHGGTSDSPSATGLPICSISVCLYSGFRIVNFDPCGKSPCQPEYSAHETLIFSLNLRLTFVLLRSASFVTVPFHGAAVYICNRGCLPCFAFLSRISSFLN